MGGSSSHLKEEEDAFLTKLKEVEDAFLTKLKEVEAQNEALRVRNRVLEKEYTKIEELETKIKELKEREDGCLLKMKKVEVQNEELRERNKVLEKEGTINGEEGLTYLGPEGVGYSAYWAYKVEGPIMQIIIRYGGIIDSISFENKSFDGVVVGSSKKFGGLGGYKELKFCIDTSVEQLSAINLTQGVYNGQAAIASLCFYTNLEKYEAFGDGWNNRLCSVSSRTEGGVFAGFCGYAGKYINAIDIIAAPKVDNKLKLELAYEEREKIELPDFFVLKSSRSNRYLQLCELPDPIDKQKSVFLRFSGQDASCPSAKFQVEKAKSGVGLVHIKCCSNNKYWVRKSLVQHWIVAEGDEPEENQSNWSCTLFRPEYVDGDANAIRFWHVQSGLYDVCLWSVSGKVGPLINCLFTFENHTCTGSSGVCKIIDWNSLKPRVTSTSIPHGNTSTNANTNSNTNTNNNNNSNVTNIFMSEYNKK